jgi:hypothetical protein
MLRDSANRKTGQPVTIEYRSSGGENPVLAHVYTVYQCAYDVHTLGLLALIDKEMAP